MKKAIISVIIIILAIPVLAQKNQETGLKREVTLYNPYKPSLPDVVKKSYLPDMTDTAGIKPEFVYHVRTYPFMPPYNISPVRPATMQTDPLPKLYNSYIKLGFGTYLTPIAEISITNQRSKKGAVGFYARHFSTNGNIKLQNDKKAFAGYMDNDASVYGKRFLNGSILNGSVDFAQKTRYAYGYDTSFTDYNPAKKDIRLNYFNAGANIGLSSSRLDSSVLSYNFRLGYNFFSGGSNFYQHNFGITGEMAKRWKGFYAGAKFDFNYYKPSDSISLDSKYLASINPFIRKSTGEWNLNAGLTALLDKDFTGQTKFHIYPDVSFGFNIVPDYLGFLAELTGRMENNNPLNVINENPYILPGKDLYDLRNTNYALEVKAGFRGETGIEGTYRVYAAYSIVNDMLFYSNYVLTDSTAAIQRGQYFIPLRDDVNILNFHGDMNGKIAANIWFEAGANYYKYTMNTLSYPLNKPSWDALLMFRYNLKDKIIIGAGLNATGKRDLGVTRDTININLNPVNSGVLEKVSVPANITFNFSAEYRYTKILSFWVKLNNISFSKYYEWAYFPTQRFIFMAGFTYSL
jgi:hypothetical protein